MVLQQFAFPEKRRAGIQDLYIRVSGTVLQKRQKFYLKQGASIQTDTYFNGFFSEEWRAYTILTKISCTVEVQGKCMVEVFLTERKGKRKKEQVLERRVYSSVDRGTVEFCFPLSARNGMVAVRILAITDTLFYGGRWEDRDILQRSISIALVTCTYHKEVDLMRNLKELNKRILEDPKSPLFGKLQVYVVDNGGTVSLQQNQENPAIHIIANRNTGGSGGFIRGIQEVIKEKEIYQFSHILLMDDDVRVEISSLEKMAAFLRLVKEEYRQTFLGGAMLRNDYPWIQHEAGGIWKEGKLKAIGQQLDLRKTEVLLQSRSRKERPNYAAWWYCCIPLEYIEQNGYPLPFFLHFDDVEYSLREKQVPIYIHGIGIWHEPFEQKRSSALVYYDTRNSLFTYQLHGDSKHKGKMLLLILYELYQAVARYRYKDIKLIQKAVEDYKKGLEWLYRVDAEKLHQAVCHMGYQWKQPAEREELGEGELREETLYQKDKRVGKRIWRLLTINGNLLPVRKDTCSIPLGATLDQFYRVKRVYLYDPVSKMGEWLEKDWKGLMGGFWKMIQMMALLYR